MNHFKELKYCLSRTSTQIGIIISLAIISIVGSSGVSLIVSATDSEVKFSDNLVDDVVVVNEDITIDTIIENKPIVEEEIIVIESREIPVGKYASVESHEQRVNVEALYDAYMNPPEMSFDYKQKKSTINCLWEFLVNQQHVDPILASAIIANAVSEGDFGLKQGTQNNKFTDIEDCRQKLQSEIPCGYGIIQWTFPSRRLPLLEFYEDSYNKMASDNFTDEDWMKVMMSAECSYLLEEMRARNIIARYEAMPERSSDEALIESITGLLCKDFIGYAGSETQWTQANGSYYLCDTNGSGYERLRYAKNIYSFYTK